MYQSISTLYEFKQMLATRSAGIDRFSRQFLEFAIDNPYEIAFGSLTGVAAKSGVARNTAMKTMRSLGFDSFRAFRELFRNDVRLNSRGKVPERVL